MDHFSQDHYIPECERMRAKTKVDKAEQMSEGIVNGKDIAPKSRIVYQDKRNKMGKAKESSKQQKKSQRIFSVTKKGSRLWLAPCKKIFNAKIKKLRKEKFRKN